MRVAQAAIEEAYNDKCNYKGLKQIATQLSLSYIMGENRI